MEPKPVSPILTPTTDTPVADLMTQVQALTAGFTPTETAELTAMMTADFLSLIHI